jgi:DNA-binding winged helix-turn-helix (wHTH) protein/Tol biopolymer transport system component
MVSMQIRHRPLPENLFLSGFPSPRATIRATFITYGFAIQPKSTFLFRFAPFEVDVAAGQLRKHGLKLRLSGQPLEILLMLLEHPGSVVSREEIQQRLWSTETFVDFENSLNKAINKLRQALSDSPDQPAYIETLPRRGYRFLKPVQKIEVQPTPATTVAAPTPAPAPTPSNPPPTSLLSRRSTLLFAVSLFPLAALWLFLRPQPVPRVLKLTPLTSSSRADIFGRLHTDGVRLFFLERRGHHWQLSQMPASGGAVQPFPTPFPNAKLLAISPDASEFLIASFTERGRSLALWLMPSVGGIPRRLGDIMANDAVYTPDGSQITFSTLDGIFQVTRDALNLRKLLDLKGPKEGLAWSPDGKELRFEWIASPQAEGTLWSIGPSGENLHLLFSDGNGAPAQCCGRFSKDGRYYFFVGFFPTGERAIFAQRENRGLFSRRSTPQRLDSGPLSLDEPAISPDARRLFALAIDSRSEYVRVDPTRHTSHPLLGGESASWLNISSSTEWAVYRDANGALSISKLDGTERRQLAAASLHPEMPAFTPDGKQIAFGARPDGARFTKICIVSAEGGPIRDLVSESFSVLAPTWSHDGSKLLYAADPDDPAHTGIFYLDLASNQKHKIPASEGFWKSRFSPDGKFIVSVTSDTKTLSLFDFATQQWTVILHGHVFSPVAWSPDSRSLFFQDILEDDEPVHRYTLATRKTDLAAECRPLLEGGILRCGFEDLLPDNSVTLQLTRGDHNLYSIDLSLP